MTKKDLDNFTGKNKKFQHDYFIIGYPFERHDQNQQNLVFFNDANIATTKWEIGFRLWPILIFQFNIP